MKHITCKKCSAIIYQSTSEELPMASIEKFVCTQCNKYELTRVNEIQECICADYRMMIHNKEENKPCSEP